MRPGELETFSPLDGHALGTPMVCLRQGRQHRVVSTISAAGGTDELLASALSEQTRQPAEPGDHSP